MMLYGLRAASQHLLRGSVVEPREHSLYGLVPAYGKENGNNN